MCEWKKFPDAFWNELRGNGARFRGQSSGQLEHVQQDAKEQPEQRGGLGPSLPPGGSFLASLGALALLLALGTLGSLQAQVDLLYISLLTGGGGLWRQD